jgi:hypothetical protein
MVKDLHAQIEKAKEMVRESERKLSLKNAVYLVRTVQKIDSEHNKVYEKVPAGRYAEGAPEYEKYKKTPEAEAYERMRGDMHYRGATQKLVLIHNRIKSGQYAAALKIATDVMNKYEGPNEEKAKVYTRFGYTTALLAIKIAPKNPKEAERFVELSERFEKKLAELKK